MDDVPSQALFGLRGPLRLDRPDGVEPRVGRSLGGPIISASATAYRPVHSTPPQGLDLSSPFS